jgi:hypothetical protein
MMQLIAQFAQLLPNDLFFIRHLSAIYPPFPPFIRQLNDSIDAIMMQLIAQFALLLPNSPN